MRTLTKYIWPAFAALAITGLLAGCGDSPRNDQGVSFTFLGWFQRGTSDFGGTGLTFITGPISGTGRFGGSGLPSAEQDPSISEDGTASGIGGGYLATAGVQNQLANVGIRVDRIFYDYIVPGSSVEIPSTSVSMGGQLGPAASQSFTDFGQQSTLPEGFSESNVAYFANTYIVPPDVMSFINLNRTAFPEPPFVMVVSAYISGVTTAGERVNTNRAEIDVYFTPDNVIPPTGATGAGVGGATLEGEGNGSNFGTDGATTGELGSEDTSSDDGFEEVGADVSSDES